MVPTEKTRRARIVTSGPFVFPLSCLVVLEHDGGIAFSRWGLFLEFLKGIDGNANPGEERFDCFQPNAFDSRDVVVGFVLVAFEPQ